MLPVAVLPGTQLLRCQYLYVCTSKASKLRTWRGSCSPLMSTRRPVMRSVHDGFGVGSLLLLLLLLLLTLLLLSLSAARPATVSCRSFCVSICTFVLVKQVN